MAFMIDFCHQFRNAQARYPQISEVLALTKQSRGVLSQSRYFRSKKGEKNYYRGGELEH